MQKKEEEKTTPYLYSTLPLHSRPTKICESAPLCETILVGQRGNLLLLRTGGGNHVTSRAETNPQTD